MCNNNEKCFSGLIRCNWCNDIFDEGRVEINGSTDEEVCPSCGKSGFLMDLIIGANYEFFEEEIKKAGFEFEGSLQKEGTGGMNA